MNITYFLIIALVLVLSILAQQVPTQGCVTIENRSVKRYLVSSTSYDADRRHVEYERAAEKWTITRAGTYYRITHARLGEDLYESEYYWNGNYLFTWKPRTRITDGGAWWVITPTDGGFFRIRNVKFGHCLYTNEMNSWICAYEDCDSWRYEWKISAVGC
uniref:Putative 16.7 kDa salivary peptide n=1 Tax=Culex tarsalis TaxID=7177 RepID=A0A1Q3F4R3_CULTA